MRGLILVAFTAGAAAQQGGDAVAAAQGALGVPGSPMKSKSPIEMVVAMLQKMQTETRDAAEKDAEQYDQMQCWCRTNGAEKKAAIKAADKEAANLASFIDENAAEAEQLASEIAQLKEQRADDERSLAQAKENRAKENAAFNAKNAELLDALSKLEGAINALKKHNGGGEASFIQLSTAVHAVKPLFKQEMQADLMEFLAASSQGARLRGVSLQQQMGPGYQSYNARSGQIFGILQGLHDQMTRDNKEALDTEKKQEAAFNRLRAAKEQMIQQAGEMIVLKTNQKAKAQTDKTEAEADLRATNGDLAADREFVKNMKETCKTWDDDYAKRTEVRAQEQAALDEALGMLRDEATRDVFNASSGSGSQLNFVQVEMDTNAARKARAIALLRKSGNAQLSALAVRVRLDGFEKVKAAIDEMVAQLKAEKQNDVEMRDYCEGALRENHVATDEAEYEKSTLADDIDGLETKIQTLSEEIEEKKAQEKETLVSIKKAGLDRAEQSVNYQKEVSNNYMAKDILNKVLVRLQQFYAPEALPPAPVATIQKAGEANDVEKPKGFGNYENNSSAGGVLAMIQKVIQEVESGIAEAEHDDQQAQKDYADFMRVSTEDLQKNRAAQEQKASSKANAEGELAAKNSDNDDNNNELETLAETKAGLHKECDFTLNNFDIRQQALEQEIESLGQAKAILSGAM